MRRFMSLIAITCATLTAGGCACTTCGTDRAHTPSIDKVALLQDYLTGAFSSADQHAEDSENFFDIRLVCVPIWQERADGPWLYIEQAAAESPDQPYRSRVYHLMREEDGRVRSDVYTLPGERYEWAGAWRDVARFDAVAPEDLDEREGCSVYLELEGSVFVGGTEGDGCSSSLGDAAYATSEMRLFSDRLITWDRGWTADGEQAWGAEVSGYEFLRVEMP